MVLNRGKTDPRKARQPERHDPVRGVSRQLGLGRLIGWDGRSDRLVHSVVQRALAAHHEAFARRIGQQDDRQDTP